MTTPFVAVVPNPTPADRTALLAAGADAVLSWPELLTSTEPDDAVAVLLDAADHHGTLGQGEAALEALAAAHDAPDSANANSDTVIVTTRPVTDTLKLVDLAGALTGTAEREQHRFVHAPIAARLRLLRSVSQVGPDPVEVLRALADRGVTVLGTSG